MFSEVLKIIPRLDRKELANMEKQLGSRFTKLAKGFGKGMASALKGGGLVGLAIGLIDKVLNPLKEVQEAMDRTLKSSADVVTNAQQFGTSAGKLFKLQQLARSKGIEEDQLYMLIGKFQTAVAEARQNPGLPSTVGNFTKYEDSAEGFFQFIQSLQRLSKDQQILAQQEVFGEKQVLRMASFLQTNFEDQIKLIGAKPGEAYTPSLLKLDGLDNLAQALEAKRTLRDRVQKGGAINEGMIRERDKSERIALERENARIQSYTDLAAISQTTDNIMKLIETGTGMLGSLINTLTPAMNKLVNAIDKFMQSPMVRGIKGFFGGKED